MYLVMMSLMIVWWVKLMNKNRQWQPPKNGVMLDKWRGIC